MYGTQGPSGESATTCAPLPLRLSLVAGFSALLALRAGHETVEALSSLRQRTLVGLSYLVFRPPAQARSSSIKKPPVRTGGFK